MKNLRLAEGEYRFARIVWENEPLPSGKLVELALKEMGWKKSTTYTVLKKLVDRGILRNENAVVTSVVPREAVLREESRAVVERSFDGSLPSFLAHFMGGRTITDEEADQLKAVIDRFREGERHG
ncbi:MAG: BlaI/MecI/CopY family transcriptional regulator [Oscillospiraceae bacterium]|nr:BlaI/MecI/CopY family transcriptional regulator [Oscillospiraceae bacterium]